MRLEKHASSPIARFKVRFISQVSVEKSDESKCEKEKKEEEKSSAFHGFTADRRDYFWHHKDVFLIPSSGVAGVFHAERLQVLPRLKSSFICELLLLLEQQMAACLRGRWRPSPWCWIRVHLLVKSQLTSGADFYFFSHVVLFANRLTLSLYLKLKSTLWLGNVWLCVIITCQACICISLSDSKK